MSALAAEAYRAVQVPAGNCPRAWPKGLWSFPSPVLCLITVSLIIADLALWPWAQPYTTSLHRPPPIHTRLRVSRTSSATYPRVPGAWPRPRAVPMPPGQSVAAPSAPMAGASLALAPAQTWAIGLSIGFTVFLLFFGDKQRRIAAAHERSMAQGKARLLQHLQDRDHAACQPAPSPPPGTVPLTWVGGAACQRQPGKPGESPPQSWRGACYCDHDCGEDSFLVDGPIIGVADGVGGWRAEGVDPAIFANKLMENVKRCAAGDGDAAQAAFGNHPAMLMHEAYAQLLLKREVEGGSATCCLATLTPDGLLRVANLGDSALLLLRDGVCVYRSAVGMHSFNTPHQLEVPWRRANYVAADARIDHVQCHAGDVVVVASDGLYDNLFDNEVAELCHAHRGIPPRELARALKEAADVVAASPDRVTPFQLACERADYEWSGGKTDDITVVVAKVQAAT
eukprot:CAMPEP_0174303242 /NCGR_PEP_ID=MMETSP0809-20121228/60069_1 /TAXON_ID=73025 ORGANISM="Eutreptiella gymnastica-like, Strain CCMP1594" /NCGR_SAMPLE_ID=MMETSP0809 /ASSEMBLY_ACC=CAM_ASM_000658 /LENGTH=453 /DNA_ID=CAMNT_0015409233 /DNA_START=33 /DNA_END=1394 /DNA_ORIENTATION=+